MAGVKKPVVHIFSKIGGLSSVIRERLSDIELRIVDLPLNGKHLSTESRKELQSAEVLLADPLPVAQHGLVQDMPKLKWMMSTWAGTDSMIRALDNQKPLPKYQLTKFSGFFGPMMSEFVLGYIIERERKFHEMMQAQEQKVWEAQPFSNYRILSEMSLGIFGLGDIGKTIATVAKAFGMTVWGLVQTIPPPDLRCPAVDEFRRPDDLPQLLASCDYICNVLPSTPRTAGLLSWDTLAHCRQKKPVFINVGRGDIIDEASILKALDNQWISHAILDVLPVEPLPTGSPLWSHPHVTITPHVSAVSTNIPVGELFIKNLERYVAGKELLYPVVWEKGY